MSAKQQIDSPKAFCFIAVVEGSEFYRLTSYGATIPSARLLAVVLLTEAGCAILTRFSRRQGCLTPSEKVRHLFRQGGLSQSRRLWSAVTGHRFSRLADLSAKQSRTWLQGGGRVEAQRGE